MEWEPLYPSPAAYLLEWQMGNPPLLKGILVAERHGDASTGPRRAFVQRPPMPPKKGATEHRLGCPVLATGLFYVAGYATRWWVPW